MKHIIMLSDGMANWPVKSLGNKTLLQYIQTPYMDKLARIERVRRLVTVADGFHSGSKVTDMSVLGYNLLQAYKGRGPLEATSIGVGLQPGEMAMRCNLICTEGDILKNHSAEYITTEEADVSIGYLQEKLDDDRMRFHTGIQYRHLLVMRGGNKQLGCTPPHDMPLKPFHPLMVKPLVPETEEAAGLLNEPILKSQELLRDHPLNLERMTEDKNPASSTWPWSPGYHPRMGRLSDTFPQVKRGAVISAVNLIDGIGYYTGLRHIAMEGATGLYDTNYENEVVAALEALRTNDFVYLHTETSDETGHEGDMALKLRTIENLDGRAVGPVYKAIKDWDEPVAIAVLPDHPTPYRLCMYTNEPVPFFIWYPGIKPDSIQTFDKITVMEGSYGLTKEDEFTKKFMNH